MINNRTFCNNGKKVVIALGGNAILTDDPSEAAQIKTLKSISGKIVELIKRGYEVTISHGNGPQVGNLLLQQKAANSKINPALPLDTCVAMTQGSIGYWTQNTLKQLLKQANIKKDVVSLITQAIVDKDDTAFKDPTKPIGPFLTKEEAEEKAKEEGNLYKEDSGRGWRKVVPSPKPVGIVEAQVIKQLMGEGVVTISAGGGGIPVIETENGYEGVEAVIDKDFAAEKLAELIEADYFIILTGVEHVYINFNKENQKKLETVTVDDLNKYIDEKQFAPGSMLPKIQAAIEFANNRDSGVAVITSLDNLVDAVCNSRGTRIVRSIA